MEIKTIKEFDELIQNNKHVVVDFFAEWCGPCKMLGPVFEQVSKELSDIKFAKINVDNAAELSEKYNVQSIPTILYIKDGKIEHETKGFLAREELIKQINKIR